jgi:hypothetical protein
MTQQLGRPEANEYAAYYGRYISLVPAGEIVAILEQQRESTAALLKSLSEAQGDHRYAPGKWTIKELVGHVADTERVFSYRAAHISRSDPAPLPSMEQEIWSAGAESSRRTLASLDRGVDCGAGRDGRAGQVAEPDAGDATWHCEQQRGDSACDGVSMCGAPGTPRSHS